MLDFPNSPTTGQTFTAPNGTAWHWDGAKWGSGTVITIPDAPSDANTYGRHAAAWSPAAPIASPTFTGAPSLPTGTVGVTQAAADSSTALATTAFVKAQGLLPAPGPNGSMLQSNGTTAGYTRDAGPLNSLLVNANAASLPTPVAAGTAVQLGSADGNGTRLELDAFSNGVAAAAPNISWRAARGTGAAPTALQSGDFLGTFTILGYGATGWSGNRATINFNTTENWTDSAQGTQVRIGVTPTGGVAFNSNAFLLDGAGNLTIAGATATKPGGGSWTAPSDRRLKSTSDTPYQSGLAEVIQLAPINYNYNGVARLPTGQTFYGVEAQAAMAVMPELVGEDSYQPVDEEGHPQGEPIDYLTVDSGPLIYALVNCVKELAARVGQLEALVG
jgi:hypothetical protein